MMALNKELLNLLACPKCRGEVVLNPEEDGLVCNVCAKVYPVREDIPVMLMEEAVPLDKWLAGDKGELMKRK